MILFALTVFSILLAAGRDALVPHISIFVLMTFSCPWVVARTVFTSITVIHGTNLCEICVSKRRGHRLQSWSLLNIGISYTIPPSDINDDMQVFHHDIHQINKTNSSSFDTANQIRVHHSSIHLTLNCGGNIYISSSKCSLDCKK